MTEIMDRSMEIERIKACMEDYLRQRGIPLRKPFRCLSSEHEDRHPSMSYNPRAHNIHCFSCGVSFDLFDLIGIDYSIDDFAEQYRKACELFGFDMPRLEYSDAGIVNKEYNSKKITVGDRTEELKMMRIRADGDMSYFRKRGITAESCKKYGLFQLEGCAYFPIWEHGRCSGWSARAIDDNIEPRYKNSSGPIGLWNSDYLERSGNGEKLFVTEGIIDAICLEQMGERAIALCGSQNTNKLMDRLDKNALASSWKYILCGDSDAAGEKMNSVLKRKLEGLELECAVLPIDSGSGDIGQMYIKDRDKLSKVVADIPMDTRSLEYNLTSAASGLEEFFLEVLKNSERGAISTGFAGLDKLLDGGLYPGLYIMGAVTSIGKTSFALQIADYISENCSDVLFFSLEQSRFELMAKSMSRTSALLDGGRFTRAFTARQLLSGTMTGDIFRQKLLEDTKEIYSKSSAGLFIREGIAEVGLEEVRKAVREHREQRGRPPVVIVDYLQILRPSDSRSTDKQNTDRAVVELKRLSRDFDIPVIAISSFNRENYRAAVSMEAFKESGAVEYSSDVLLGLQLAGAGEKDFDVNRAKAREPRKLELVLLKNRSGIPYAKLKMEYRARFSLFSEV